MGKLSLGQMGGPKSKYFMSMLTRKPHFGQAALGAGRGAVGAPRRAREIREAVQSVLDEQLAKSSIIYLHPENRQLVSAAWAKNQPQVSPRDFHAALRRSTIV